MQWRTQGRDQRVSSLSRTRTQEPVFWRVSRPSNFFRGGLLTLQPDNDTVFFQTFLFNFCFFLDFQNEVTEIRGKMGVGSGAQSEVEYFRVSVCSSFIFEQFNIDSSGNRFEVDLAKSMEN